MNNNVEQLFDLRGKTALVIGGAVNLGFDISHILAAAGCDVALTSRDYNKAIASAERLENEFARKTLALQLDHTSNEEVHKVFQQALSWKGKIDIVVNNAGGGSGLNAERFPDNSTEDTEKLIDVNLTGTINCCREAAKIMKKQKNGKIINIASIAGVLGRERGMYDRQGMTGQAVEYAAAKAGVIGLTKDLAALLAPHGIYVNSISPGGFDRDLPEGFAQDYSKRTPLGRMGRDGSDIKGPVLFLASLASDYVNGHNLLVDGGFTIWQ